jgi:hypothetical protein
MVIISRLLNTVSTIRRIVSTISDSGEDQNDLTTVAWGVASRITRNKQIPQPIVGETGVNVASTHKIFTNVGVDVQEGDYIYNTSEIYVVSYIDKKPGGILDSHYEIYANELGAQNEIALDIVS